jgi:hypothetical protein
VTFFVQGVREYGPLKTGFAFLPVAFVIGIVSQIVARILPRVGAKPLLITGTSLLTIALLWFSTVSRDSGYAGKLLPGMFVLAVAMGCLFVPLTTAAVANVANTDAGLASALLNVGQQVGGALGLSVMTTVFGTSAKNWASAHMGQLHAPLAALPADLQQRIGAELGKAGSGGLQSEDIKTFISGLPPGQRGAATSFFSNAYSDFTRELLAFASGKGFLTGAAFGVVAIISAVVLINVKKTDVPTTSGSDAVAVH